jgi:hypothetical protein
MPASHLLRIGHLLGPGGPLEDSAAVGRPTREIFPTRAGIFLVRAGRRLCRPGAGGSESEGTPPPKGTAMNNTRSRSIGLALFGLLSLADIATLALTDGEHPPYAVALVSAVLGLVTLVLVIRAHQDAARGLRLLIGLRVLSAVSAVPAFFVSDVPAGAQVGAGAIVVLTAAGVLLTARGRTVAVA